MPASFIDQDLGLRRSYNSPPRGRVEVIHARQTLLHSLAMLGHGLILAEPLDVSLSVRECGLGLLAATSGGGEAIVGERAPLLGVTMPDA